MTDLSHNNLTQEKESVCEWIWAGLTLKHTTTLFSLPDHYMLSREWRVIVDLLQTSYHGSPIVLKSVRCDRTVDYEGSSLCSNVF